MYFYRGEVTSLQLERVTSVSAAEQPFPDGLHVAVQVAPEVVWQHMSLLPVIRKRGL